MLDCAFVSEQQWTNDGAGVLSLSCRRFQRNGTYGPLTAMSAMTFDSPPFPTAKLSLYSACSSGGGGNSRGNSVWQMGKYVFLPRLPSPSYLNQLFCNLHDF